MAGSIENRVHQRHPVKLDAEVLIVDRATGAATATIQATVRDVSYGGLRLEAGRLKPEVLRELELGNLELQSAVRRGGQLVQLKGRAAWTEAVANGQRVLIGVRFLAAASTDVQTLVRWAEASRRGGVPRSVLLGAAAAAAMAVVVSLWRASEARVAASKSEIASLQLSLSEAEARAADVLRAYQKADREAAAQAKEISKLDRALRDGAAAASKKPVKPSESVDPRAPRSNVSYELRVDPASAARGLAVQIGSLQVEDGVLVGMLQRSNAGPTAPPIHVAIEIAQLDRGGVPGKPGSGCTVEPIDLVGRAATASFDCAIERIAGGTLVVNLTQTAGKPAR